MGTILATVSEGIGTVTLNVQIPNTRYGTGAATAMDEPYHVPLVDVYEPAGVINKVFCGLPGGGDNGRHFGAVLGFLTANPPTVDNVLWAAMEFWNCAVMMVTGTYLRGVNPLVGAGNNPWNPHDFALTQPEPNYSNHTFWDGIDTPQFIRDCRAYAADRWGVIKGILAGHSSGGIMVQRMWHEHEGPTGWAVYGSVSGPESDYYIANPTVPSAVKPFLGQYSANDDNLGITGGHFQDALWHQQDENRSLANVDWPDAATWIGQFAGLQARVDAYNAANALPPETVAYGDGVVTAAVQGTVTTWTYSGGANLLRLLSYPGHSLADQERAVGVSFFRTMMGFAAAN